jgi:hypothetical protein
VLKGQKKMPRQNPGLKRRLELNPKNKLKKFHGYFSIISNANPVPVYCPDNFDRESLKNRAEHKTNIFYQDQGFRVWDKDSGNRINSGNRKKRGCIVSIHPLQ